MDNTEIQSQLIDYIASIITISDLELEEILSRFRFLKVEKNNILIANEQTSQRMFFVGKGCLRIFFITENGQEATRYLAFENNFATALCSFISNDPSMETIQALEETHILYISQNDFYDLLKIIPSWEKFYRYYLELAYVNNTYRLMSFLTQDASKRYQYLLDSNPSIVLRLPNKIVASYLNISQETLSRLKSRI